VESVPGLFFSVTTTAETPAATFNGVDAVLHISVAGSCTDTLGHTKDGAAYGKFHVDFSSSAKKNTFQALPSAMLVSIILASRFHCYMNCCYHDKFVFFFFEETN